jgi:hypothetical protein
MPQRLQFGGPSEIYLDEYPNAPCLVHDSENRHDTRNSEHIRYFGLGSGVMYRQRISDSALRDLSYNALVDQRELQEDRYLYPRYTNDSATAKVDREFLPGAMGAYWVRGTLRRSPVNNDDDDEYDRGDDIKSTPKMKAPVAMRVVEAFEPRIRVKPNQKSPVTIVRKLAQTASRRQATTAKKASRS